MSSILDGLSTMGAGLIRLVLTFAMGIGCIAIGIKAFERTNRPWAGWLAGVAALLFAVVIFYPAIESVQRYECRNATDFEACMDPEEG